jgi:hypothetical protein
MEIAGHINPQDENDPQILHGGGGNYLPRTFFSYPEDALFCQVL